MITRNLRWRIIATCFAATTINYIDRQCLSVAAPVLSRELHLSNAEYSSVVTSFLLAYTIMQAAWGRIIDRIGTRAGMVWSIVIWSVAGMLHAFSRGLWSLRVFRFLLGFGEAGNWPAATKVVSEWFPARERSLAVAIFDSGSSLGGIIAPPLVAWILVTWGWRPAFIVTGAVGFVWLVVWLRVYHRPEEHPRIGPEELELIVKDRVASDAPVGRIGWLQLLGRRQVWGLIFGRMLTDCVWWFYVYWLPKYLTDQRGFSIAQVGALAWIPFLAVDFGNLGGGWFSGRLVRRGYSLNSARKIVMGLGALGMTAGIPAGFTENSGLCLALIAVATLSYAAWGTLMLTLPSDMFPSSVVASVSGLSGMGAGLGGIVFTWAIGNVIDRFSYQPVFLAAGILPLMALAVVQLFIPRIHRVEMGK